METTECREGEPIASQPDTDTPLTQRELEVLLTERRSQITDIRIMAAILDVASTPMTFDEVQACFDATRKFDRRYPLSQNNIGASRLVSRDRDGRLVLNRQSPYFQPMRQTIRAMANAVFAKQEQSEKSSELYELYKENCIKEAEEALRLRRAVIRFFPVGQKPVAAAVIDINGRDICTFYGEEMASLTDHLAGFDLLIGTDIHKALAFLELAPDRWRIAEIDAPRKSLRLNKRGRTLKLTLEMFITSSTRISRPLGEARKMAAYLANGEEGKLRRRLESDAKALFAFYQYGKLHRHVRLRWGFKDEIYPVNWEPSGDPCLNNILEKAREDKKQVEVVMGSAPGWQEPWARARCYKVSGYSLRVICDIGGFKERINYKDIQAVRIVESQ